MRYVRLTMWRVLKGDISQDHVNILYRTTTCLGQPIGSADEREDVSEDVDGV
jgi:hypothetical protein